MRVQRVQIEQQMARLQIQSQRARLKVERAERQMEIINEPASMKVDRDYGKISIDATELENNTARRDVYTLQDVFASNSLSQAQQGIKSIAQGGDFVADLPNNSGGSLISARVISGARAQRNKHNNYQPQRYKFKDSFFHRITLLLLT